MCSNNILGQISCGQRVSRPNVFHLKQCWFRRVLTKYFLGQMVSRANNKGSRESVTTKFLVKCFLGELLLARMLFRATTSRPTLSSPSNILAQYYSGQPLIIEHLTSGFDYTWFETNFDQKNIFWPFVWPFGCVKMSISNRSKHYNGTKNAMKGSALDMHFEAPSPLSKMCFEYQGIISNGF